MYYVVVLHLKLSFLLLMLLPKWPGILYRNDIYYEVAILSDASFVSLLSVDSDGRQFNSCDCVCDVIQMKGFWVM